MPIEPSAKRSVQRHRVVAWRRAMPRDRDRRDRRARQEAQQVDEVAGLADDAAAADRRVLGPVVGRESRRR